MSYQVKIEVFEGPFDLLLSLIAKQKVDIYDIPIAKITDEYLAYIKAIRELDLEVATEFLLVASALLSMKAEALLPKERQREQEDISPEEARENLIARLIEYRKFKSVSMTLTELYDAQAKHFAREFDNEWVYRSKSPFAIENAVPDALRHLFLELTKRPPSVLDAEHIAPEPLRVDLFMDIVRNKLASLGKRTFRELTLDCSGKSEVIACFLAVLELYKRGEIEVGQAEVFGEIEVKPVVGEAVAV